MKYKPGDEVLAIIESQYVKAYILKTKKLILIGTIYLASYNVSNYYGNELAYSSMHTKWIREGKIVGKIK